MPAKLIEVNSLDFIIKDRIRHFGWFVSRPNAPSGKRTIYLAYIFRASPKWFNRHAQNGNILDELDFSHELRCDPATNVDRVIKRWNLYDTNYCIGTPTILFGKFKTDTELFLFKCENPEFDAFKIQESKMNPYY